GAGFLAKRAYLARVCRIDLDELDTEPFLEISKLLGDTEVSVPAFEACPLLPLRKAGSPSYNTAPGAYRAIRPPHLFHPPSVCLFRGDDRIICLKVMALGTTPQTEKFPNV